MNAAPQSTERRVLIAVGCTFLFFAVLMAVPAFHRPAPVFFSVAALYLVPAVIIGWLIAALHLAWSRKWRAALMAALLLLVVIPGANWGFPVVDRTLADGAVRLEFVLHRRMYDALVSKIPKDDGPRFIRVSQYEVDDFRPHFEEIWLDDTDALGSADWSVSSARFYASHPKAPGQTRATWYTIRPLGGHYYFIDVSYPSQSSAVQ